MRRDLIDPTIALLHGRVVDRAGDGTIVEFRAAILIADMVSSFEWAVAVLHVAVVRRRWVAPSLRSHRRRRVIMTDLSEAPTRVGVRRTLARWYRDLQSIHSPILRYGLAVVCVGIAIGLALTLHRHEIHETELPIFVLSIALIAWYAGAGPTLLAVVLAALCLNYFWAEPGDSPFSTEGLTNLFTFVTLALIVSLFSIVRRQSRGKFSSSPRWPSDRGGTTSSPRGRNQKPQPGT